MAERAASAHRIEYAGRGKGFSDSAGRAEGMAPQVADWSGRHVMVLRRLRRPNLRRTCWTFAMPYRRIVGMGVGDEGPRCAMACLIREPADQRGAMRESWCRHEGIRRRIVGVFEASTS